MGINLLDVLIVGAGISGISAACHLRKESPDSNFAIVEARENPGGTWDLFRYPGIRSDSDMHTFGFNFKPWAEPKVLADGGSILSYVKDAIEEYDLAKQIHYGEKVSSASFDSASSSWQVELVNREGVVRHLQTRLLFMCAGYYRYEEGFTPAIKDLDTYSGQLIHPQQWPDNLEYGGKNIAVIGSGATAMTLVPALAATAASVTMIQRSPTYVIPRPSIDIIAKFLNAVLPLPLAYKIVRWKNIQLGNYFYRSSRKNPAKAKEFLLKQVRKALGSDFDIEKHFTPSYDPWDQRVCVVPEGDLFTAIKKGKAHVVTGTIDSVNSSGVLMTDGTQINADILVTATGLNLQLMGGVAFFMDGEPIDFSKRLFYQGMLISGVPNLIQTFGYVNASWTLRADLNSLYVTRLLNHMKKTGATRVSAELLGDDVNMTAENPFKDFQPGYMKRGMHLFPKQGDHAPWQNTQNYLLDRKLLGEADLEDGVLQFS